MNKKYNIFHGIWTRVLLVLFAFILTISSSCFIMSRTLNNKLRQNADEVINDLQRHTRYTLMLPETSLYFITDHIKNMFLQGKSYDDIKEYMQICSSQEFKERINTTSYYSIYGYFYNDNTFFDGGGYIPSGDYNEERYPWFVEAMEGENGLVVSKPYIDFYTDDTVISYLRLLRDSAGQPLAIIGLDVSLSNIKEIVSLKHISENSFGFIVDAEQRILVHNYKDLIGLYLRETTFDISRLSDDIENGKNISLNRMKDYRGVNSVFFGRQIDNGWYLGMVIPESEYYQELYQMILIISLLGAVLAMVLIFMLVKIELSRKKADEENQKSSLQLAELRKTHEVDKQLQLILNAAPILIYYWDRDLNLSGFNTANLKIFGVNNEKEHVANFSKLSPKYQPDGRLSAEASVTYVEQAFEEGACEFEWMHCSLDGTPIPTKIKLVRIKFKNKDVVVAYVVDLSKEKEMLNTINTVASQLDAVLANYSGIIWNINKNGEVTLFRGQHLKILGLETSIIEGKTLDMIEQIEGFEEFISSTKKTFVDGPQVWVQTINDRIYRSHTSLVRDDDGNMSSIVGSADDVTELMRSHKLIELQLAKLNLIVKGAKIGLWDVEVADGEPFSPDNVITWSDELLHMLGFTDRDEFPNIFDSLLERLHPEEKDIFIWIYKNHLLDKTGKISFCIENQILKKDGTYSYFRSSGETIRDADGNPVRFAGALTDITESMNVLIETEKLRQEAESANRTKSSFLANMSHEIRTPMNAILGITEVLIQNDQLPKDVLEGLDKIYNSSGLLLGIINDLLDFSKIEAGKMEIISELYEIASLVNDSVQLNMMRINSKPIEFLLLLNENIPAKLIGDELRIKQLLNNLLSNAFKYTESGRVTFSVDFEPGSKQNEIILILTVQDTGYGMSQDQLNKLFDEYSRFNMNNKRIIEGAGLGMAITQRLIQLMSGEILVESEPNKGSTFTLRLPQDLNGSADILGKEVADSLRRLQFSDSSRLKRPVILREYMPYGKILLVDDVQTNLFVAKLLLKPYGMKIETASSGFEAIDKINQGNIYDIIFMDHMMPKMDGIETTTRMRALGYEHPIVALTANAVTGQAEYFLSNGFNDFLSKPIDMREINKILNTHIRDKHPLEVIEAARAERQTDDIEENRETLKENSVQDDLIPNLNVPGLNTQRGLDTFEGNTEAYTAALFSFVKSSSKLIGSISDVTKDTLPDYATTVHGFKSACRWICASDLGERADRLETLAKSGDLKNVLILNEKFIQDAEDLIKELSKVLQDINNQEDNNHQSLEPVSDGDIEIFADELADLLECGSPDCMNFISTLRSIPGTDKIIRQMESYDFEQALNTLIEFRQRRRV